MISNIWHAKTIIKYCIFIILLLLMITFSLIAIITNYTDKVQIINIYHNNIYLANKQNESSTILIHADYCSTLWREQYQIPMNNSYILSLNIFATKRKVRYEFPTIPKGTFTYWLSHIESKNRIKNKTFFANKFLIKQYIINYTKMYPEFEYIYHAKLLEDFSNGQPSFEQIKQLKRKYKAFVVKPNHFSGKLIIVKKNESITKHVYKSMMRVSNNWLQRKYKVQYKNINREEWYLHMTPRRFIEENINIDYDKYHMTEYKIMVLNYRCLFLYVIEKTNHDPQFNPLNMYLLPEFKLLNVSWVVPPNKDFNVKIPSKENLNKMMKFAEHFAKREQFNFVRVDLYEVNNKIFFSEFTFAPIDGTGVILPISFDYLLFDILCENKQKSIDTMRQYVFMD
eukprot:175492_1